MPCVVGHAIYTSLEDPHTLCLAPAGLLQLFGGVLGQKRRAEKALEESGIAYTIIRPGGMERPGDDYKQTHNVRLATRDTWFGGQVSRLQVAELAATAAANGALAENKVSHHPASAAKLMGAFRFEVSGSLFLAVKQNL